MNDGGKFTENIYVWLAQDLDGIEGIIAIPAMGSFMPLLASDKETALSFKDGAGAAARMRQQTARLVVFHKGETIAEITGTDQ